MHVQSDWEALGKLPSIKSSLCFFNILKNWAGACAANLLCGNGLTYLCEDCPEFLMMMAVDFPWLQVGSAPKKTISFAD